MKKSLRSSLLLATGGSLLFLVGYRYFAPQLRGSILLYAVAAVAFAGLTFIVGLVLRERETRTREED